MFTEKKTIEMCGATYQRVVYNGTALYRIRKHTRDGSFFWSSLNPGLHRSLIREIEAEMQAAA
ncbi:hypothetical protein [Ralstonia syzygii]|uniref:Uncharacterized protein n=1 Tax=Ralstonia syzygii R24 TaxID=907261 RepID=G3A0E9_9RALS|nr:hypothetical protein [Ralstonia syzygii]CCA84646.1 conserved hypothetical protein [Ralstonia syzygii R24]